METTEKEEKEPGLSVIQNTETEKKREIISVQVTPEEKRLITRMAVKDCGISVSEFVRTKVFMEQKPTIINDAIESPITDEERAIYEEKLSEVNEENKKLKEDIVKLKVSKADPKEIIEPVIPPVNENSLNVEFDPKTYKVFDQIKNFREEKFSSLSDEDKAKFIPFEKYLKVLLLRGLKRSYYGGVLNSNTGLTTDEIREMAKAESIDYDDEI